MMKAVIDTNVLLQDIKVLTLFPIIIMPTAILEELDGLKKAEGELGYKARLAIKALEEAENIEYQAKDYFEVDINTGWEKTKRDNQIVYCAKVNDAKLISNDINVRIKAEAIGVPTEKYARYDDESYDGFTVVKMNDEELAEWYGSTRKDDKWDLPINHYLVIHSISEDKVVDVWVRTDSGFRPLSYAKKIESSSLGKFASRDIFQNCVLDSLYNNQMTMVKGKAGTGKSLITLSYALSQIEKGKYEKLIVFCNTVATKGSAKLGYYPGSKDEKLMDSQIGNMLSSKLGDKMEVERFLKLGKLVLLPFSDIRGFDTTGMNAIVWITEAQNLDIELMKLAIQRIGNDTQLILDGDYTAQVDSNEYAGDKNGMRRVSEVFRGEEFYGEVELQIIYRSKLAEIADKL